MSYLELQFFSRQAQIGVTGVYKVDKATYLVPDDATHLLVDSTFNPVNIFLPDAKIIKAGDTIRIKDVGGNSATNPISIYARGTDPHPALNSTVQYIDGSTSKTLNWNYSGIAVSSDESNWFISP